MAILNHCHLSLKDKNRKSYLCLLELIASNGLTRWLSGNESTCQHRRSKRHRFDPWVGKIPWRRKWQPTPVILLGKSHGQRSLTGCSPRGPKDLVMSLAIYVSKANSVSTSAFKWKPVVTRQTLIVKRTWMNLCFIYGNHSFQILSDAGRLNILQFNVCEAKSLASWRLCL